MDDDPDLADLVKTRRKAKGLTQAQLGKMADVDQAYISRIESGESFNVGSVTLGKLERVLGVRLGPARFWADQVERFLGTPEAKALKVTADERRRMLEYPFYQKGESASALAWVDYLRTIRGVTGGGGGTED